MTDQPRDTKSRFGELKPTIDSHVTEQDYDDPDFSTELNKAHEYSGAKDQLKTKNSLQPPAHWRSGYAGCAGLLVGFSSGYFGLRALQKYAALPDWLEKYPAVGAGIALAVSLGYIVSHIVPDKPDK